MDGEADEDAELQGATASALLLGFGSSGVGIWLDATRDDREEMGGAMAAGGVDLDYPQTVAARRAGSRVVIAMPRNSSRGGRHGGLWMFEPATAGRGFWRFAGPGREFWGRTA